MVKGAYPCSLVALLILFLSASALAQEPAAEISPEEKEGGVSGPEWILIVSPTGGWLRNTTSFPIPVGSDADGELIYEDYSMTDDGWGGGVTIMAYYKRFALTNVFFGFPDINSAKLLGSITYLTWSMPTGIFLEPYLGLGFVAVNTDADFFDFNDVRDDDLGSTTLRGFAHMDYISVDNRVLAPFPKAGAKIKIPIQHWTVTPFYSFMYENVRTSARSSGGSVELWELDVEHDELIGDAPMDTIHIRDFDTTTEKDYYSHMVGANFFLDFHYFLQLRGSVYYNANHDLWTLRLIGSMMFHEHVGLTAYFEYSEKITVTNTYFLLGPAFMFTPPGFMDEMMARRKAKMGGKR